MLIKSRILGGRTAAPTIKMRDPKHLRRPQCQAISTAFSRDRSPLRFAPSRIGKVLTRSITMRVNSHCLSIICAIAVMSTIYAQETKMEHPREINAVAVSPDGKLIASGGTGSDGGVIKLWNSATRQEIAMLTGHGGTVQAVAFSKDGRLLASGEMYSIVKIWDVASKKELATLKGHTGGVNGVAFSPDGKTVASASTDQKIILWDSGSGAARSTLSGHKAKIVGVAYSADGKRLASADEIGTMIIWDVPTGKQLKAIRAVDKDYRGEVVAQRANCMAFSPDGKRVAAGIEDQSVRVWDVDQGTVLVKFEKVEANGLAFSADGSRLAAAGHDNVVKVFRTGSANAPQLLTGHDRTVRSVAFMPDGSAVISGSFDHSVRLWAIN
jgi:WD40 repeat protein